MGNTLGSAGRGDGDRYGLRRLRYLIIWEDAYSHLAISYTILESFRHLKEIRIVTKDEILLNWPENKASLFVDGSPRLKGQKGDKNEGSINQIFSCSTTIRRCVDW